MSLCAALAGGALLAALSGDRFTLAWTHSVEKIAWEETYEVGPDGLVLAEARILGSGAGMEPPEAARFVDGAWVYRPDLPPLPELRLALSPFAGPTRLCGPDGCVTLEELTPPPATLSLYPCPR